MKELTAEWGVSYSTANSYISRNRLFRDKYIIIEDIDPREERFVSTRKLIMTNDYGRSYYATSDGEFFSARHGRPERKLKLFLKDGVAFIKIDRTDRAAKNLIAELYLPESRKGDVGTPKEYKARNGGVAYLVNNKKEG